MAKNMGEKGRNGSEIYLSNWTSDILETEELFHASNSSVHLYHFLFVLHVLETLDSICTILKRGLEFFSPTSNWYDIWELTRAQRVQFSQYNSLISKPLAQWTTSQPGRPSSFHLPSGSWHLFAHRFHRLRAGHFRRGWFSGWRFHFSTDTQSL